MRGLEEPKGRDEVGVGLGRAARQRQCVVSQQVECTQGKGKGSVLVTKWNTHKGRQRQRQCRRSHQDKAAAGRLVLGPADR